METKIPLKIIWSLDKNSIALSLCSLHDSGATRNASIQPFREDISTSTISPTSTMLVAVTAQEWRHFLYAIVFPDPLLLLLYQCLTCVQGHTPKITWFWIICLHFICSLLKVKTRVLRKNLRIMSDASANAWPLSWALPFTRGLYLIRISAIAASLH